MINLAEDLQLTRPLAVLDLETTGFDPEKDRIVQIALTIHYPHRDPIAWSSLVNPGIPITNASESHGITDDAVRESPSFLQIAPALAPKILNVDMAGYNVVFDIGFMRGEMKRAGVAWDWKGHIVDSFPIYRRKKPHNLSNAYVEYGGEAGQPLPEGSKLEGAHDAGVDVRATEIVLRGQLRRHTDLPRTVPELEAFCFPQKANAITLCGKLVWHNDEACIAFGKHARNGPLPLRRLDRGYMQFILDNDFPADMKEIIQAAMMGVFPKR